MKRGPFQWLRLQVRLNPGIPYNHTLKKWWCSFVMPVVSVWRKTKSCDIADKYISILFDFLSAPFVLARCSFKPLMIAIFMQEKNKFRPRLFFWPVSSPLMMKGNYPLPRSTHDAQVSFQCRNCYIVSCMDCNQLFNTETFDAHVKCITEDQKYGGKGYVPKENKGEAKQEAWFEQVGDELSFVRFRFFFMSNRCLR